MTRPAGTAICYLRDSQGESDQSPVQYIPWVLRDAARRGLAFRGGESDALDMARSGSSERGDLYMDYGVSGKLLNRPGLDALRRRIVRDRVVSHVYVPRRDRLARPDDPLHAVAIEAELRRAGVTIVMLDKELPPIAPGSRHDLGDLLGCVIDYHASGGFRRELAQKLLLAKVKLAESGYSIGGDPPYGFRRWLVATDGVPKRELERGERVKMAGHHVIWLPSAVEEVAVLRRVVGLIVSVPAARIARQLNDEGVPSPGAGRRGASGLWTQNTVKRVATHPILTAVLEYGRRGEGDQQRLTAAGPRDLRADEFDPVGRAVNAVKPDADLIRARGGFDPLVADDQHARVLAVVEERGRNLRGKPRSKRGVANPLGGRVFDSNCGWPMYRNAKRGGFGYSCALYANSQAKCCSVNMVSGEAATRFVLGSIRQRVLSQGLLDKLKDRLRSMAESEAGRDPAAGESAAAEKALEAARKKRDAVGRNMALASSTGQYEFLASAFEGASAEVGESERRLRDARATRPAGDAESEVRAALAGLDRIADLAAEAASSEAVAELVAAVDAKLYLSFRAEDRGRRRRSVPAGGVLTFGATPAPVRLYQGPTDRVIIRRMIAAGESVQSSCGDGPRSNDDPEAEIGRSRKVPRVTRRCSGQRGPDGF